MNSFAQRSRQHDGQGLELVRQILEVNGCLAFPGGIEIENKDLWNALCQQYDTLSLMMRFRPDLVCIAQGHCSFLCEVKTENGTSPNFAIECDSYLAARAWNQYGKHVIYAFVDLSQQEVRACFALQITEPEDILVPKRQDALETLVRLKRVFRYKRVRLLKQWHNGSGTAFFLMPKDAPYLRTVEEVLRDIREQEAYKLLSERKR